MKKHNILAQNEIPASHSENMNQIPCPANFAKHFIATKMPPQSLWNYQ
jgi:hypothetical protein